MANLQKRGGYTPRRARERRAYRLVVTGATTGVLGIVTLVLAVAGVMGYAIPVILILVALACVGMFRASVN
jgi:CHASE2 domain-containing sensor protein